MFGKVINSIVKIIGKVHKRIKTAYASFSEVETKTVQVRKELEKMGLLFENSRLSQVMVYYHFVFTEAAWAGWKRVMGFYFNGNIHIPAFWPPALSSKLSPMYCKRPLLDVIRHEFGHALEGKFYNVFHSGKLRERFLEAFGAPYGRRKVSREGDESNYVSEYARDMTQEDFAETFMFYMKHKGRIPKKYMKSPAIRAKWKTVDAICKHIAQLKQ